MKQEAVSRPRGMQWVLLAGSILAVFSVTLQAAGCLATPMPGKTTRLVAESGSPARPATVVATGRPDSWWQDRHARLKQQAANGRVGLLFLGDSITERMGMVHDLMDQRWGKDKPANFGIGGDSTQHLLWRLQDGELNGLKPKAVVLLIGTNNIGHDSDDDIVTGVKADIEELRRLLPNARVLVLALLPRGASATDPLRSHVRQINEQLSRLPDNRSVFFIDVNSKLLSADGTMSRDIMPDLVHPSRKGYELIFNALAPAINPLLR